MMEAALSGIRVADFSHVFAGPYCTLTLADMGADVVKIEPPNGDATRTFQPPSLNGESPSFLGMNRNKRGIVLNLTHEEARQIALDIALKSDVLVENFATGVMERFGLDYATLSASNPKLIYCSISAYGRSGEFATRAGYDAVIQAESGMMSLNGHAETEPHKTGLPFVDLTTGMFATQAILAALFARARSGLGQFIDVPLFDTAVNLTSYQMMNYLASGINPQRLGNRSPVTAPVGLFQAADGSFFLNIAGERVWLKLVGLLGNPIELCDPGFESAANRVRNEPRLMELLQTHFVGKPLAYWLNAMRASGVPAGPVLSIAEAAQSDEVKSRGLIGQAPHTTLGHVPNLRLPIDMSRTPLVAARGAPVLGEHTSEVLADWLDYAPERIAQLASVGITAATSS